MLVSHPSAGMAATPPDAPTASESFAEKVRRMQAEHPQRVRIARQNKQAFEEKRRSAHASSLAILQEQVIPIVNEFKRDVETAGIPVKIRENLQIRYPEVIVSCEHRIAAQIARKPAASASMICEFRMMDDVLEIVARCSEDDLPRPLSAASKSDVTDRVRKALMRVLEKYYDDLVAYEIGR